MNYVLSFSAFMILLVGCGSSSNSGGSTKLSSVDIYCATAQDSQCGSAGMRRAAYLGLSYRGTQTCAYYFSHASFNTQFDAFSEGTTALYKQGLTARFDQFYSATGEAISQLKFPTALACSFIDINNNKRYDSSEPFLSQVFDPTKNTLRILDQWQ